MNYSEIIYTDMINGEGIRVSVFVSGCSHKCPGCFNQKTWDENYGKEFTDEVQQQIFDYFEKYRNHLKGLSLLGGDPTYDKNIEPLIAFINKFKQKFPEKNIWIWSGYKWEMIKRISKLLSLVSLCDILVDGRFVETEKDLELKWRGSRNQRVIDIQKSLKENQIVLHCE